MHRPKEKNKLKIKFEVALKTVSNISAKSNEKYVYIAWKRGKKKGNRGESKRVKVTNGVANFADETFTFEATLVQFEKLKKFEEKKMELSLKEVRFFF